MLVQLAAQRGNVIAAQIGRVGVLERELAKQRNTLAQVVPQAQPGQPQALAIAWKGKCNRYLSLRGSFALATRRNLGNVAARDLGCTILENVSRQTVIRCEINFQAA
eukprot:15059006-Alexandrium_andersonii.AAC.1